MAGTVRTGSSPSGRRSVPPAGALGCRIRTDRAVSRADHAALDGLARYAGPAVILYGEHDIFGTSTDVVRHRLPRAVQVTLKDSGHLHWLQNQDGYRTALRHCYSAYLPSVI